MLDLIHTAINDCRKTFGIKPDYLILGENQIKAVERILDGMIIINSRTKEIIKHSKLEEGTIFCGLQIIFSPKENELKVY